jgi:ribosomal protein S18 acetylase RimI-like enzyme
MIQLVPDFSIFVRHAVQDDAAVLARHLTLSELEATQYRGSVLATSNEVAQTVALVAGVGTTVMGSLVATAASTTEWSINSVFVEAASRDIGIGDALVLECIRELQQRNATWLQSSALPGDRAMKNLFERHGLVAQTIIVGKKL